LVLDLDATGSNITRAHSLSPDWQILSTTLTPAPTVADSPGETGAGSNGAGMMLKIVGTDGRQASGVAYAAAGVGAAGKDDKAKVGTSGSGMTEADFQALMGEFDEGMKILRTVVESGGDLLAVAGEEGGELAEGEEHGEEA
jgi:hypothetical protein